MSEISIFGLGYVGVVSACCLANDGHFVLGVEPNQTKVDLINNGKSPIIEDGTSELIQKAADAGRLKAITDPEEAVRRTELSLICVGTPSQPNGSLDLKYVRNVSEQIGIALKQKQSFHVVVYRSTMLPSSMRDVVIPALEKYSDKKAGIDFGVCTNPEFLREGTAVYDYYNPPKIVIGQTDERSGDLMAGLYSNLDAPTIRLDVETAGMVKYADNAWHAVKVCFANEIGNICEELNIDGHRVMDVFCQDSKLNLSPYYLKPGFAFGGSCLPKDVRALTYMGRSIDVDLALLNAILPSNRNQIERGFQMIASKKNKKIGILGFSFKAGTDDLRESPMVEIIERLLGKGYDIRIYDRNVNLAKLTGANRDYILNHISHIAQLMTDKMEDVLDFGQTIVVGNNATEFHGVLEKLKDDQVMVDFVRITGQMSEEGKYEGICW
ncbi:MAG: UDP-glucose/GDP-mannose dehydrogenase family protein [Planctomycetes bacterium]|nr:UDP-glucose/GDP-mannose dehydrogenase family protein [Planctomycetota bacterium]